MLGASDWVIIGSILAGVAIVLISLVRSGDRSDFKNKLNELFGSQQGFFQLVDEKGTINDIPCEFSFPVRNQPNYVLQIHKTSPIAFEIKIKADQAVIDSDNQGYFAQQKLQEMIKQIFDSTNPWRVAKLRAIDDSIIAEFDQIDSNFDPQKIRQFIALITSLTDDFSQQDQVSQEPATNLQGIKFSTAYKFKGALLAIALIVGFFVFMPLAAMWQSFDHINLFKTILLIFIPSSLVAGLAYRIWLKRADLALLLFACIFEVALGCYVYTH